MAVILTGGQSWEQIAADYTLSAAYAPAIAIQNNMEGVPITGVKYRIEIPDAWMKPEYAGKQINLMDVPPGAPAWVWLAMLGGLAFLIH